MKHGQGGLSDSCVVHLRKRNDAGKSSHQGVEKGEPRQPEFSCSGVVIDSKAGLILTSGQVFAEVLKKQLKGCQPFIFQKRRISTNKQTENIPHFTANDVTNIQIDVISPVSSSSRWVQKQPPLGTTLHTVTLRADLVVLWKCKDFDDVLKTFVPERDGWQFSESKGATDQSDQRPEIGSAIGQSVEPFGLSSVSKDLPDEDFLSWFALLKLKECNETTTCMRDSNHLSHPLDLISPLLFLDSLQTCVHRGDSVCLCTTPFGATCPSVFLNSISMGVVSNVAGPRRQLIMTDARCIPGSEGGGMYLAKTEDNPKDSILAGIIVAPLCWKNNEWIGLTLVCSLQAVMESLRCVLGSKVKEVTPSTSASLSKRFTSARSSTIQRCMRSVVLIKDGGVWGSGVIVNTDRGIILTCRHVVDKAENRQVRVRIDFPYMHWKYASVIYSTNLNSPFDLAVLQLEEGVGVLTEAYMSSGVGTVTQGQPVIVIGHALLAPEHDLLPTVSAGVISQVISVDDTRIMLQSTCAVHAGTSGGPLLCATTGRLLGIVTSNARDMDSGASFPHINFSIPWSCIDSILAEFFRTEDVKDLQGLSGADNKYLRAVWSLDERRIAETHLLSKL